ncbi:hypothetical protein [Sanguibacteroides sp. AM78-02pH3A]|uniref:Uncharacterized protein n=1 Tax=Sanguibacteroides justesenii TaxID=1547597 RepID=A0A0C3MC76_9PORP|nr:hypothetical protein [Sanguibacteroides sp. AM78-02pH3A]KIO44033.1 hypothetical protein BA92_11655 [Sanguibacteroides justesenii]KIO47307.1 hypothetical protein IE90_01595 [Sanguibacteroides justesenii]
MDGLIRFIPEQVSPGIDTSSGYQIVSPMLVGNCNWHFVYWRENGGSRFCISRRVTVLCFLISNYTMEKKKLRGELVLQKLYPFLVMGVVFGLVFLALYLAL